MHVAIFGTYEMLIYSWYIYLPHVDRCLKPAKFKDDQK